MEDWRNEKMGEQGAGSSTMSARSTPPLEPKTAALVGVAAAIAAGETAELEARLGAARGAGVPVLWIERSEERRVGEECRQRWRADLREGAWPGRVSGGQLGRPSAAHA